MKIIPEVIIPEISLIICGKQCPHFKFSNGIGYDANYYYCDLSRNDLGFFRRPMEVKSIDGFPWFCPLEDKEEM